LTSLRGGIQLAAGATRASSLVAMDAIGDRRNRSLPLTPDALADPAVMSELLGRPVRDARLTGDRFDSSNCQNFLVEVVDRDGASRTLYAKLPAREFGPRVFANTVGYWKLECTFCDRVASQVSVRVPEVHAAVQRGSRFVLLLENVAALRGARMFVNADMAAGTTPEQARRCITAFAELHAGMHDLPRTRREQLLPLALHPQLAPKKQAAMQTLNRIAVKRAHANAPDDVMAGVARIYERALDQWDDLLAFWYTGPLTLVHGDSHLANCFEYETDAGPAVGLLDFQGVHWSKGIRDVAYFLIHSLDSDLLATHESALIDHYLEAMAGHGVDLDPDGTRAEYRAFSFQALQVGVVAVGLGGFNEREATVRTMLQREIAAVERLDFAGWLASLPPRGAAG
jgi:hypothetical protein